MKTSSEELKDIKDRIEYARSYFNDNYDRFNEFRDFIYNTTLSPKLIAQCAATKKPAVEIPLIKPYISRFLAEFSKNEPSILVTASEDAKNVDTNLIDFLEGHLRAILSDADRYKFQYEIVRDLITGGFSVARIYTDYIHSESFDQKISMERVYDPTLSGFDPNATESHKGDGEFCFSLHPVSRKSFIEKYGKKYEKLVNFSMQFAGYNWTYAATSQYKEGVLLCEWFEKSKKSKKILLLSNGSVVDLDKYKKMKEEWDLNFVGIGVFPEVVSERVTDIVKINRKVLANDIILESQETDYSLFPLVFIDGDSVILRSQGAAVNSAYQRTLPMIYSCKGIQQLKNYAASTLANELENLDQNKYVAMVEAIPEQYKDAYTGFQQPRVLLYHGFHPKDQSIRLDKPEPLPRMSAPPELFNSYVDADRQMQVVMGANDSTLEGVGNDLSGVAISRLSIKSNAMSMPYVVNYLSGLGRILEVVTSLIPKYYVSQRNVKHQTTSGRSTYREINSKSENGLMMNFNPEFLKIKVDPGVNFEMQRQTSFMVLKDLAASFSIFREFIETTPEGIEMLLKNLNLYNTDELKKYVEGFLEKKREDQRKQEEIMEANKRSMIDPLQLKNKELELKARSQADQHALDAAKLDLNKQAENTKSLRTMAEIGSLLDRTEIEKEKHQMARADKEIAAVNQRLQSENVNELLDIQEG